MTPAPLLVGVASRSGFSFTVAFCAVKCTTCDAGSVTSVTVTVTLTSSACPERFHRRMVAKGPSVAVPNIGRSSG